MKQVLFILLVFISFQGFSQKKIKSVILELPSRPRLEVMTIDLGQMKWYDALKACHELESSEEGYNWRLPTKYECDILFKNKVKIGGFSSNHYWTSNDGDEGLAWDQTFDDGYQDFADMNDDCNVRAVRV